jgi:hypothetical protein
MFFSRDPTQLLIRYVNHRKKYGDNIHSLDLVLRSIIKIQRIKIQLYIMQSPGIIQKQFVYLLIVVRKLIYAMLMLVLIFVFLLKFLVDFSFRMKMFLI